MAEPTASDATIKALGDLAADAGIAHVHLLAWRDLDDVEAGGSELHAHNVASIWAQAGLQVSMRTSFAPGRPERRVRSGYTVVRKAGRYLVFPRSIASEISGRLGPRDGLVEIWNGMPFFSPVWCRGPRMVWLHHVHGPMWAMTLPPRLAQIGLTIEEQIAPRFYRRVPIVTLAESSKQELVHDLGFSAERVSVVPPGIDARYSPGGERSATPMIVAVGRLVAVKDFARLIRVAAVARETVEGLSLVIVGDGYERDALEKLVGDLHAESWVRLAGRVSDDELVSLYRRAWIVASASIREGWGMTITEAAACGTPAVATRIAGHTDAIQSGVTGLLADTDDELASAIALIMNDRDLRERMSAAALKNAASLTWEATAIGTFSVLADDALRRARSPR